MGERMKGMRGEGGRQTDSHVETGPGEGKGHRFHEFARYTKIT
jgi:hypothetical protein